MRFPSASFASRWGGLAATLVLGLGVGCTSTRPPVALTPAQREVLATTERFFAALEARDSTALRALLQPRARVAMVQDGVQVSDAAEWSAGVARAPEPLVERIWDPRIEVDGDLASLWAPYSFHIGARFSHCGHDAFHFVREGGAWRLISVLFTRQRAGCPRTGRPGG